VLTDEQLDAIPDKDFEEKIGITKYEYHCLMFLEELREIWGCNNITMFLANGGSFGK